MAFSTFTSIHTGLTIINQIINKYIFAVDASLVLFYPFDSKNTTSKTPNYASGQAVYDGTMNGTSQITTIQNTYITSIADLSLNNTAGSTATNFIVANNTFQTVPSTGLSISCWFSCSGQLNTNQTLFSLPLSTDNGINITLSEMNSINSFYSLPTSYLNLNLVPPATPKNITLLSRLDTSVIIKFDLNYITTVSPSYIVNITPTTSITTSGDSSSFTISGLTATTTYSINIQLQNSIGNSLVSSNFTFTTVTAVAFTATGNFTPSTYGNYRVITFNTGSSSFKFNNLTSKVGYVVTGGGAGGSHGYTNGIVGFNGGSTYSAGAAGSGGGIAYSPYSISNATFNTGVTYTITVGSGGIGGTSTTGVGYGGDSSFNATTGSIYAYGGLSLSSGKFSGQEALRGTLNGPANAYTYPPGDSYPTYGSTAFNTGIGYNGIYNGRGGNGGGGSINGYTPSNGSVAVDLSSVRLSSYDYKTVLVSAVQTYTPISIYPSLNYVCLYGNDINITYGLNYNAIFTDISVNIRNFCGGGGGGSSIKNNNGGSTRSYGAVTGAGNGGFSSSVNGNNAAIYGSGGGGGYNNYDTGTYGNGGNGFSGCVIIYFPMYF